MQRKTLKRLHKTNLIALIEKRDEDITTLYDRLTEKSGKIVANEKKIKELNARIVYLEGQITNKRAEFQGAMWIVESAIRAWKS